MDLPVEIRNHIYELVLGEEEDIYVKGFVCHAVPKGTADVYIAEDVADTAQCTTMKKALRQPPLTRASKAIRNEVLPIFYGSKTITMYSHYDWAAQVGVWLRNIGSANRKLLLQCWVYCSKYDGSMVLSRMEVERRFKVWRTVAKVGEFVPEGHPTNYRGFARLVFEDDGTHESWGSVDKHFRVKFNADSSTLPWKQKEPRWSR